MFLGHFGVGFALKRFLPAVSLGTAFLATQFIDLLWPTFLIFGLESVKISPGITVVTPLDFTHYPITHSLVGVLIWSFFFALVYFLSARSLRVAIVLGLAVFSHWILDLFVHRPDLPLTFSGSVKVGFGLWNSMIGTLILEFLILAIGLFLYGKVTKAVNNTGKYAFYALAVFLVIMFLANILGSPPPGEKAIAVVGHLQWLFIIWGYWIDRNRETVKLI